MLTRAKRSLASSLPGMADVWRQYRNARAFRRARLRDTSFGFRMAGNRLMEAGTFEPAETAYIKDNLADCGVLVDVGANVGFYTCLARSLGRKVIAVEPHPGNLDYLFANLQANGWSDVEVFPLGLFSEPGIAPLFGASTGASMVESWAGISPGWKRHIAISTLDNILGDRFSGEQLLIKVDVEGAEFGLLRGAAATLARVPKPRWLVEICFTEHFPGGMNPNFRNVFELFWHAGYQARAVSTGIIISPTEIEKWVASGVRDADETNFVFSGT